MAEELRAAAVALDAEVIERFVPLSFLCFFVVVVPKVADWFTAAEAAYRDYHDASEPQVVFKPLGRSRMPFEAFFKIYYIENNTAFLYLPPITIFKKHQTADAI